MENLTFSQIKRTYFYSMYPYLVVDDDWLSAITSAMSIMLSFYCSVVIPTTNLDMRYHYYYSILTFVLYFFTSPPPPGKRRQVGRRNPKDQNRGRRQNEKSALIQTTTRNSPRNGRRQRNRPGLRNPPRHQHPIGARLGE